MRNTLLMTCILNWVLTSNTKAIVRGYGPVWFDDKAISYVFSLAAMEEMIFDSVNESAFIVHTRSGPYQVHQSSWDSCLLQAQVMHQHCSLWFSTSIVTTIDENKSFSCGQVEPAKHVCVLMHILMCPFVMGIKATIQTHPLHDCRITSLYIDLADEIFGKDFASIKEKRLCAINLPQKSVILLTFILSWQKLREKVICALT